MSTSIRPRRIIQHPLVIIPPLVVLLIFGWQQYTYAGRDLSLPSAQNLLTNTDFADPSSGDTSTGWTVQKSGDATYQTGHDRGYTGSNTLGISVHDYHSGDVTLSSPKMTIQPGMTYLFKSYYTADLPFALLARYYTSEGASTLRLVHIYPAASSGDIWSTVSDAFQADPDIVAVQLVFRLYANGQLQVDSPYLEPRNDVYVAPAQTGANTIPNSTLVASSYDTPSDWSTYHIGNNSVAFSYQLDAGGNYLQTQVNSYKDGQAKWQYTPQSVQPDQHYRLELEYQSDTPIPLVAEYVLANGQRQDQTVANLPPASEWTMTDTPFQTAPGATSLFVSLPLEQNGTVASRRFTLTNDTRPGDPHWAHPVISLSFDDGWQDAYDTALPLLNQYGYKATFYVNPSTIETAGFMSASELTSLQIAGNEIGSHGYDHDDMTAINSDALDYQLRQGRNYLQAAGFPINDFAIPYGRSDAQVQWYAREYFNTLRGSETGVNTRQTIDPYNLKIIPITAQTTSQDITTALSQAKAYNGWVIFSYHQLSTSPHVTSPVPVEDSTLTPASFRQQLNLMHASGIKVLPIAAAYQTLEHP